MLRDRAIWALAALALGGAFFVYASVQPDQPTEAVVLKPTASGCAPTLHYSYFSTPPVFDQAYADAGTVKRDPSVRGLLVPHHLLAAKFIAGAFGRVATSRPKTVVLISPNHFAAGRAPIITTAADWRTPYGMLGGDCRRVNELVRAGAAAVEEEPFEKEHGISGIVPFIRKSLPEARVIPVIVRDDASDADLARFTAATERLFGKDTIFVGSFDFTHELTRTAAQFHDRKSLAVVDAFDDAGARELDIDSRPGLRLTLRLLDQAGLRRFSLLERSDSSELLDRPDQPDVTSYLVGTFAKGEKAKDDDISVLAFGDMMLARSVEAAMVRHGARWPFDGSPRLFSGSDLTYANAEGVFYDAATNQKPVAPTDLRFPFEPPLLPLIRRVGFTHLGLANNHSQNFGRTAVDDSRALILAADMAPVGDPQNLKQTTATSTVRGRLVAQIGYSQFGGTGPDEVLKAIAAAHASGAFVIVYPHWGVEYTDAPVKSQTALAHAFIDAGADVVLGSHPHVIQPVEVYHGKAIFYSLGNFIFDQAQTGPTSQGLAVGIADGGGETTFYLMPLAIRASQASLMTYDDARKVLETLGYPEGEFTLNHSSMKP